ncbi:glycolate oxidase subunit GlcE [Ideonella livida]|uniref:Glycolate oxidase subunit GlcE n=1 Tax=Ideonella livida TaxID=2707176 RepID=A0A7C9PKV7_9BURK|nr:glycolate oxidase subunit GlcE [Ideonella livida]NDY93872.1 glycolate oxidase subunit GlcE [Ideonella livida]
MQDTALTTLVETVREATARQRPLCIRGSGSKDFHGGPLLGDELSTRMLSGVLAYEPTELVVTAKAGTPLVELEALLAQHGQCLAFEPPRFVSHPGGLSGTVGGMVAAGLAGPSRASVGSVRDYVLGATLLNGKGELLHFGGQVMKNVAGYDVSRLLAGSLGVLGVICDVSLKVLPEAPATLTLRFEMDQANALRHLNEWAGQPLPLSASAWWDDVLVLRLKGARAAVATAHQKLGGEVIPDALAQSFWRGLRDHSDEFFTHAQQAVAGGATLWRLSVAPTAPRLNLAGEQLIEWGGAQRWVVTTAPASVLEVAAAEGRGHATRFRRPPGAQETGAAFAPLSPALLRIHHGLKKAFDPAGIFNRQRLHPEF